jgi:hypothetical protein
MTALIACDLDRTLIYSDRFFEGDQGRVCVEYYEGSPLSFMTVRAANRLRAMAADRLIVPVTTRTIVQYLRIDLPGKPFHYAVTSNGGNILVDSVPDERWTRTVAARIRADGPPLDEIVEAIRNRISDDWVHTLRIAEGLFCYMVIDEARIPAGFLDEWAEWASTRGWRTSRQGRKIYTVPNALCKSAAVAEVRRRLIDAGTLSYRAPLLAAGDGALDADLLRYADAGIRPAHGELHLLDWHSEHISVTTMAGARAAEEILVWLECRPAYR